MKLEKNEENLKGKEENNLEKSQTRPDFSKMTPEGRSRRNPGKQDRKSVQNQVS